MRYHEAVLLENNGKKSSHQESGQVAYMEAFSLMNQSPLIAATKASQINVVSLLIRNGVNLEAHDNELLTALHWAAVNDEAAILCLLLEQGACIDTKTKYGSTALHLAAENNHPGIVTMLINHGANTDVKNEDGNTPMTTAILNCNLAIAIQLNNAKETLESPEDSQLFLLNQVVDTGNVELVKKALDMFGNAEERRNHMDRFLLRASQSGRLDLVSYLLHSGADIKVCDDDGLSVLFFVVGQIEALKLLLNCGCDSNSTDNSNNTALHYAAKQNNWNVAALLVEQGTDVNAKNDEGKTALHSAIKKGFVELASMLIDSDIDIEAKNLSLGLTAIHIAVENGDLKSIKLMLVRGADVNSKNTAGETALQLAAKNGLLEVCALLLKYGADVNSRDMFQRYPMYYAVINLCPSMVRLFLHHSARVDQPFTIRNLVLLAISSAEEKFSSLEFQENEFFKVMELLVQAGAEINEVSLLNLLKEWKGRFPKLARILDRAPDRFMKMERRRLNEPTAIKHTHIEVINPIDSKLKRVVNSTVSEQTSRYYSAHLHLSAKLICIGYQSV